MRKKCCILIIISLMVVSSNFLFLVVGSNALTNELTITNPAKRDIGTTYTPVGMLPVALPEVLFDISAMTDIDSLWDDYLLYAQSDLAEIGINLELDLVDWPTFVGELLVTRNYDMFYVDVDFENLQFMDLLYSEDGSLNFFNYDTLMDWDTDIGTGRNEFYVYQASQINPPDSEERIDHIWTWEQYLMDKLLPLVPGYGAQDFMAQWSNLDGYNYADGLMQSWGKMSWDSLHVNQSSSSELVIADGPWSELNPIFSLDIPEEALASAILDPLLWLDADQVAYPHILSNYVYINNTWIRLTVRDGIEWAEDPDGLFVNEYVDILDVYFSLYSNKKVSDHVDDYKWIKDMQILDQWTMDLFIDADPFTSDNEHYSQAVERLCETKLLPEHYLNQTQLGDGVTPDISHSSWTKFANETFGTGLFELDGFTDGVETNLTVNPDCWWLDPTVTNDPALDWDYRFGDFSSSLDTLVVKIMSEYNTSLSDFEFGLLDLFDITTRQSKISEYAIVPDYDVQSKANTSFGMFGFNFDDSRGTPLQSSVLCPHNPSLTIGLAVRKAIAYAIDRERINAEVNNDSMILSQHPICSNLGVWLNPDIIRYDYNLLQAKEYMYFAGYETGLDSDGDNLTDLYEAEVSSSNRFSNDTDGDGLTDWQEAIIYGTKTYDSDTDTDGLTDWQEIYVYQTNPTVSDSDGDGISDGHEVANGTDPLDPLDPYDYSTSVTSIEFVVISFILFLILGAYGLLRKIKK